MKMIYTFHYLKTWPLHWQAVHDEKKLFEIRKDDRNFRVGDLLCLQEFDPDTTYTGRECWALIIHKSTGFGLQDNYCVLGLQRISNPPKTGEKENDENC